MEVLHTLTCRLAECSEHNTIRNGSWKHTYDRICFPCMHFLAVLGDKNTNVKINYITITAVCTEGS